MSTERFKTDDDGLIHCAAEPGCETTIKNHYWARVQSEWFFQKDGSAWCPEHHPAWVVEWRRKRAAGIPPEPWRNA